MTANEILNELQALGTEGYKKILRNHGVPEPVYGVKIEELKKIQKRVKKDYRLALDLYDTKVYDARYLAGLVADDAKMTRKDLERWLQGANCSGLFEYTVPWVAAESPHGWEAALDWIESPKEGAASAGWATLSSLVAITDDAALDRSALKRLLQRIEKTIHDRPNRVKYTMNGFVIALGCYVEALTEAAAATAEKIGAVHVDMGGTACKVPDAVTYIDKVRNRGAIGKKRKTAKC